MSTVLPALLGLLYQPKVCFMHQRSWLERMIRTLPAQVAGGNPPQLVIKERKKLGLGILFSSTQVHQKAGNLSGQRIHGVSIPDPIAVRGAKRRINSVHRASNCERKQSRT